MIFSLTIKDNSPKSKIHSMINRFKPNYPDSETLSSHGVTIKKTHYTKITDSIAWDKIEKLVAQGKDRLVCSKNIPLPEDRGFKRFSGRDLMYRLSENCGITALKNALPSPYRFRIALYDLNGERSDLAELLLDYTSNLTIVTNKKDFYESESKRYMYEKGAPVIISSNRQRLWENDMVFSPARITETLPFNSNTLVFTGETPAVFSNGIILYNSKVRLSNELADLCPEGVDEDYFSCALYDIEGMYELGSQLPEKISGFSCSYSFESIVKHISSAAEK